MADLSQEKRSPIWKYFVLCEVDDTNAVCQVCNNKVSRGGSKWKTCNTMNLRKHLQQHYKEKYKELMGVEQSRKRSKEDGDKLLQPKIDETLEHWIHTVL